MTVSSFNSVSLDPPLVLFSVDRGALSLPMLRRAPGYAISVLSAEQAELSRRFAATGAEKWAGLELEIGYGGAPLIPDAIAVFECRPYAVYDGETTRSSWARWWRTARDTRRLRWCSSAVSTAASEADRPCTANRTA